MVLSAVLLSGKGKKRECMCMHAQCNLMKPLIIEVASIALLSTLNACALSVGMFCKTCADGFQHG